VAEEKAEVAISKFTIVTMTIIAIIVSLAINFFNIWGTYAPYLASVTGWLGSIDYTGAGWGWTTLIPRVIRVLPAVFILAVINLLLRFISVKIGKRIYLNEKEFAMLFSAVILSTAWGWFFYWPSVGLFFALSHGGYDALAHLRPSIWWMPSPEIYSMAADGAPTPWGAISGPISMWLTFYIGLFVMFMGISAILRKQWIEIERLPFPEATLYTTLITVSSGSKPENRTLLKMLFIGFIAGILWRLPHILSIWYGWIDWHMLHNYVRTDFKANLGLDQVLPGSFPLISISPNWITLFLILPLDVLFSIWVVWYIIYFILPIILYYTGMLPTDPGTMHNAMGWIVWSSELSLRNVYFGEVIGLGIIPLILAWKYIRSTINSALKRAPREPSQPLSYTLAYILALLGFIMLFGLFIAMGANPWSAFILPIIVIIWFLGYARIYAEFGIFSMHGEYDALVIPWTAANLFYVTDLGSVDPNCFTTMFMSYATIETWGCNGNTSQTLLNAMMAYRVGADTKTDSKGIFIVGFISTIVVVIVVFLYMINLVFSVGFNNIPSYVKWFIVDWGIDDPRIVDPQGWMLYRIPVEQQALRWGIGIVLVAVLLLIRTFVPVLAFINPVGVVVGTSFGIIESATGGAFPVLIAWIIKYIILKVYGSTPYEKYVVPICVGFLSGFTFASVFRRTYLCLRWYGIQLP